MKRVQRIWSNGLFGPYVKRVNLVDTDAPFAKDLAFRTFEWQLRFLPMSIPDREKVLDDMKRDLGLEIKEKQNALSLPQK